MDGHRHFDLALKADINGGPTTYELVVFERGPVEVTSCSPDADGAMCIDGPILLLPVNPRGVPVDSGSTRKI